MFLIEKPNPPYIVLEALTREGIHNKGVHVIGLTENSSVTLGRGHDSDIRISDISVSRCHAMIEYREGNFILKDHDSKFGTLVEVAEKVSVNQDTSLMV